MADASSLASVTQAARLAYTELLARRSAPAWWTAVVLTASSERQARAYETELEQRRAEGRIPAGVTFLVAPDPEGRRIGSGGATVHALQQLARRLGAAPGEALWRAQRVLVLHSGGDSRRLPQYSPSGKIFSPLPVRGPGGTPSTIFDETLALSTPWAGQAASGVVVGSGDVLLVFDAGRLNWSRPGVSGVGMVQPAEVGSQHGVYVRGPRGRVLSFLQKPSRAAMEAAGALLPDGRVAVDTGLLCFDPAAAARLCRLPAEPCGEPLDLYYHLTRVLTGQLKPGADADAVLRRLAGLFAGLPFHCDVVEGEFTHIGTTRLFRQYLTEETDFARLYAAHQRLGRVAPGGVRSDGVIIDSVVEGATVGPGAVVLESVVQGRVEIGAGAMVHGLTGVPEGGLSVPPDVVLHQVPVRGGGWVVRVYGVEDDPKQAPAAWFGRPLMETLGPLGIGEEEVWPDEAGGERTLWTAALFPVAEAGEALEAARWMLGQRARFDLRRWRERERMSLATSAAAVDAPALAGARLERTRLLWERAAVELALDGADVRPLLAQAPGVMPLANVARRLGGNRQDESRQYLASLFYAQAGLEEEAGRARAEAFAIIERRVAAAARGQVRFPALTGGTGREARVAAPARIDLGGGWSDTPPFCLDWGGTVLNAALLLDGECPIEARVARLSEPVIEVHPGAGIAPLRVVTAKALLAPAEPGDPYALARTALRMTGWFAPGASLARTLESRGGGLRVETEVRLPMGSGLGASSILAAALLQALAALGGEPLEADPLCDLVLELEQRMSTGGGWQDQAGGIYPGMKLLSSSPGAPQRVRCQRLDWTAARRAEFERRLVLAPTGIARVARNLLQQVVGRYLARETAAVQVLHSIKTLALEMAHALREGEWAHLGGLLDRHWQLNQILDPQTTNPAIEQMLGEARPFIHGGKLAGAGGGGFFIFLARDEEAARRLRERFAAPRTRLARHGLVLLPSRQS